MEKEDRSDKNRRRKKSGGAFRERSWESWKKMPGDKTRRDETSVGERGKPEHSSQERASDRSRHGRRG